VEAIMGLMDILNGMQNGPRGATDRSGGGMSPITMALLALLAYKAVKSFSTSSSASAPSPGAGGGGAAPGNMLPGGLNLDEILRGGQAPASGSPASVPGSASGSAGGGSWGDVLSSGLGDLLDQFHGAGKADVAKSWVGTGQNQPISPHDLSQVLTPEQIDMLRQRTGLSHEQLLSGLSEQLPGLVDQLTPDGRLPTGEEMSRTV
jgi:uncharacterized protein YidB (DUF937 family)